VEREKIFFLVSAPSGSGKTTLLKEVIKEVPKLTFTVSYTTRPPRPEEKNGLDYHFISETEFIHREKQNQFVEWTNVHGNLYGTSRDIIENKQYKYNDIVFEVDVEGANKLKKIYPDSVLIFILPPSLEILKERLMGRKTDSLAGIEIRYKRALQEIAHIEEYNYIIINDDINVAKDKIVSIIIAERQKGKRVIKEVKNIFGIKNDEIS